MTTIAGVGAPAFAGDGGPAALAALYLPTGVAPAPDGSVYIADFGNLRARVVAPSGVISTVAGNGTLVLTGNGTLANLAQSNGVFHVDTDEAGNTYVADAGNHSIRKVDPAGIITTIAGTGRPGYSGDGGPASQAQLNVPFGVAVAPDGSVYIADSFNHRIRRVSTDGIITTIAGTGVPGFTGDALSAITGMFAGVVGLDVDQSGNIYAADIGNNRVRLITTNGFPWTIAGNGTAESSGDGGSALAAGIHRPADVEVAPDGTLYIAEQGGQRVRRVSPQPSLQISTVAGKGSDHSQRGVLRPSPPGRAPVVLGDGGPATAAQLSCPTGVAVDALGNVFVADFLVSRIRMVDAADGVISTVAGIDEWGQSGDGGPAHHARIYGPSDLTVDRAGDLVIADHGNNRVRIVDIYDPRQNRRPRSLAGLVKLARHR